MSKKTSDQAAIQADEYWVKKGRLDLYIYRKRLADGGDPDPARTLFLVHASTHSGRASFDLQVPGHDDYSVMDYFARLGFDVWTMDHEGYGRSSRSSGYSYIRDSVDDLRMAMDVVCRHAGVRRMCFFGQSSGSLRAGMFANIHPQFVERLILHAFVWTGEGAQTIAERRQRIDEFRASNVRKLSHHLFHTLFERDGVATTDPEPIDALAAAMLAHGDTVPSGTYIDMAVNLPLVDPARILCPVQILRGQYDGVSTEEDLCNFFHRLPNPEKQFVIVPNGAHTATIGRNRKRFWRAAAAFLTESDD